MNGKTTSCRGKGDRRKAHYKTSQKRSHGRKQAAEKGKERKMDFGADVLPKDEARALRPWAGFKYAVIGIVAVGIACAIAEFVMRAAR